MTFSSCNQCIVIYWKAVCEVIFVTMIYEYSLLGFSGKFQLSKKQVLIVSCLTGHMQKM